MNVKDEEKTIYNRKQSQAFGMYLRQMTPAEIAAEVCVTARAVQKWILKFNWKSIRDDDPPETVLQKRVKFLMWIDEKSERQLNELDLLLKHYYGQHKESGENSKPRKRKGGRPSNKTKNDISGITKEMLDEFREKTFFLYQLNIWATKQDTDLNWMRFYLKSRQIGLTYYFAYEAFEDAVLTGDNQVFLSASKKQSEIFKTYIRMFALKIGEVNLMGKDEITLSNGATFYFLSTNSRTSQGYSGHLYIDEVFWIPRFEELDDLAGGISMHSKWRTTYLSTPSSIAHEAYKKWEGKLKEKIDISHKALKRGALGADGIYRQIITVDDAIEGGADFFDMEKLRKKYPDKDRFDNLLRCIFLDDAKAVFKIKALMACKVESRNWRDVNFDAYRPAGDEAVWVGYDPSGEGDEAAIVVALPPKRAGGAIRLIEKLRINSDSYKTQAAALKEICERYNVDEMVIDATGIGDPVAEMVEDFFPKLTRLVYNINTKNNLVYKSLEVINNGRLLFDGQWDDVVHSFLMIRRETTQTGKSTFKASRNKDSSHADLAHAIMHLLSIEGINETEEIKPVIYSS